MWSPGPMRLLLGALTLLLLASPARADRETADFFTKRGDRLLQGKDLAGAAEQYRRAIGEDETFLPAHVGLGDALLAQGKTSEAAAAYRAAVGAADATKPLPAAWTDMAARARKRLTETDATGVTFERLQATFADALVALADKWKTKDPALCERALRLAIEAVPDHPAATERLGVFVGKGVVVVFDGKAFDGFTPKEDDDTWKIADGILRGGLAGAAKGLLTERLFDPDLDVRMEARVIKRLGDSPKVGLVAAGGTKHTSLLFGSFDDLLILDDQKDASVRQRIWTTAIRNLKPTFDPSTWTKYEMRLRRDEVTLFVNGVLVRKERRPKERQGGVVGVHVQDALVEVRAFEVVLR
jgi:tetratricopeptide (TPR) repeat protein